MKALKVFGICALLAVSGQSFANSQEAERELPIALQMHKMGLHEMSIEHYTKAAELGNVMAQYNLGTMHYSGIGVQKDIMKAIEWTTKAANQGDAGAQFNLYSLYRDGEGVAKDENQAKYGSRNPAKMAMSMLVL